MKKGQSLLALTLYFLEKFGAGTRNRTTDLLITNQLLYQLSYAGFILYINQL